MESERWSNEVGPWSRGVLGRLRDKSAATGVSGAMTAALNKLLVKGASLDIVHVLLVDADDLVAPPVDTSLETRFLTPDEVRHFSKQPDNELPDWFALRADRGLDLCYAVLSNGRLASYSWFALRCVEPDHAAGVALGLPSDVAYVYKAFTHPAFRGRRLYAATTAGALRELNELGIEHLLAFVYWHNASAMRACTRMGYRSLGVLAAGPSSLLHAPEAARKCGICFGVDAQSLLAIRLSSAAAFDSARGARPHVGTSTV